MTAGLYVKLLLEKRDISLTELTKKLGFKSRSGLYRLFDDYYSNKKTNELIERIKAVVQFDDEEQRILDDLLVSDTISSFFKKTRPIMKCLLKNELDAGYIIRCANREEYSFKDIINKYSQGDTDIIISGIEDEKIIGDIESLLKVDHRTRVHAYLRLKYHRLMTAYELMSMIVLARHENYLPYICDFTSYSGICILSRLKGEYWLVSINISETGIGFVETVVTKKFYEYILGNHLRLVKKYPCIREPVNKVSDYIEVSQKMAESETGEFIYAEGAPCFGNLKFSILLELFKKADYFGFPLEHRYVQSLIDAFRLKESNRKNNKDFRMLLVFDEEHIKYMMQTGISFDHLELFEPMSGEQCSEYFNELYDNSNSASDRIKYRFLEGEMLKYPFVYKKGSFLYLYNSVVSSGECSIMLLKNSGIIEIMDDFTTYLWNECTYSEDKSENMLKRLMNSNLKHN